MSKPVKKATAKKATVPSWAKFPTFTSQEKAPQIESGKLTRPVFLYPRTLGVYAMFNPDTDTFVTEEGVELGVAVEKIGNELNQNLGSSDPVFGVFAQAHPTGTGTKDLEASLVSEYALTGKNNIRFLVIDFDNDEVFEDRQFEVQSYPIGGELTSRVKVELAPTLKTYNRIVAGWKGNPRVTGIVHAEVNAEYSEPSVIVPQG